MKNCLVVLVLSFTSLSSNASDKDSTINYNLPDSVKAVQFMADITLGALNGKKEVYAGIKTDVVSLSIEADRKEKEFVFEFPKTALIMAKGLNTDTEKGEIGFAYNWSLNETYRLLISTAADSAGNFTLYSGYILLPKENKWKLIGTCKINGRWNTLQSPAVYYSSGEKISLAITTGPVWIQRSNGSWKNMKNESLPNPTINLYGHIDSVQQRQIDIKIIENAIASGKTDVKEKNEGVYYTIMKEGTGRLVTVNDTVTAFYKGYLFENDSIFDQTRDKPATFPLKRLIRGWQIGVPLCRIGGRIKLVIPSDLAYSIRTRAAKIPPNSILVFEIEVVDAKSGN